MDGATNVLAILARGTLESPSFVAMAVTVRLHADTAPVRTFCVVADPLFVFPDEVYWDELLNGDKVNMSKKELRHTSAQQVLSALKLLLKESSARISPQASEALQKSEMDEITARLLKSSSGDDELRKSFFAGDDEPRKSTAGGDELRVTSTPPIRFAVLSV